LLAPLDPRLKHGTAIAAKTVRMPSTRMISSRLNHLFRTLESAPMFNTLPARLCRGPEKCRMSRPLPGASAHSGGDFNDRRFRRTENSGMMKEVIAQTQWRTSE